MTKELLDKIILGLLSAWLLWIGYQYVTKAQTANRLLQQHIADIHAMGFKQLLGQSGQTHADETVEADGGTYWKGWAVTTPGITSSSSGINVINARAHVHYLEGLPFLPLRLGPSAELTITLKSPEAEPASE